MNRTIQLIKLHWCHITINYVQAIIFQMKIRKMANKTITNYVNCIDLYSEEQ